MKNQHNYKYKYQENGEFLYWKKEERGSKRLMEISAIS